MQTEDRHTQFLPVAKQPTVTSTQLGYTEYFHSVQGEGEDIGKRVVFIRLPLCPFRCEWCDSKYAVSGIDTQVIEFEDLGRELVEELEVQTIIWTGGEPLLHKDKIIAFEDYLEETYSIEHMPTFAFETNGSIHWGDEQIDRSWEYTVSPKLGSSLQAPKLKPEVLKTYLDHEHVQFKFVVQNDQDIQDTIVLLESIPEFATEGCSITFQPEWYNIEKIAEEQYNGDYWKPYFGFMKDLADKLLAEERLKHYNWRVLPQMHKMFWGNTPGK